MIHNDKREGRNKSVLGRDTCRRDTVGIKNNNEMKPVHAKPSLYAHYFEILKEIAKEYGYNLVLHGSMNRDLDLIAIPWQEVVKPHLPMIEQFAEALGGEILPESQEDRDAFAIKYHGRYNYVININRDLVLKYQGMGKTEIKNYQDPQYYIDISVTPMISDAF